MVNKKAQRRSEKDVWEMDVFDQAVYFTVSTFVGRQADGSRSIRQERFDDLPSAVRAHAVSDRTVVYAVNAEGRFSVLDTPRLPYYLHRYRRHRYHNQESPAMFDTTPTPVYVVHWNGNGPSSAQATRLSSRALAERFAYEVLPGDRTALIVVEPGDLIGSSQQLLTTVYNALRPDTVPIKRFESQAIARERVVKALRELNVPEHVWTDPVPAAPVSTKKGRKMTETTKTTREPKARRVAPTPSEGSVRLAPTMVIISFQPNDKRPGTTAHSSYALLKTGMTVAQYIAAGGHRGQLWWNVKCGKVTVAPDSQATTTQAA